MKWLAVLFIVFSNLAFAQQDPPGFDRVAAAEEAHQLAFSWQSFSQRVNTLLGPQHYFSAEVSRVAYDVETLHEDIEQLFPWNQIAYAENNYYHYSYPRAAQDYHALNLRDPYLDNVGRDIDLHSQNLDFMFTQGGGGNQHRYWCLASDNGFEEHRVRTPDGRINQGHVGLGSSQWQAQQNAVFACQQLHGLCSVRICGINFNYHRIENTMSGAR